MDMDLYKENERLKERLAQLEETVQRLSAAIASPSPQVVDAADLDAASGQAGTTRRGLLRSGAVALGAGVAAVVATPSQAAAADGNDVVLGAVNSSTSNTRIVNGTIENDNIFTVTTVSTGSSFPAAIGGYAYADSTAVKNGIYAYTDQRDDANTATGHAIVANATSFARSNLLLRAGRGSPPHGRYLRPPGR